MGGYTETDGVYYDPNKDVIPVGVTMQDTNAVGEDYSYTDNSESIIEQNQQNIQAQKINTKTGVIAHNQIGEIMQAQKLTIILIIGDGAILMVGVDIMSRGSGWNIGLGWGWNSWYPGWSIGLERRLQLGLECWLELGTLVHDISLLGFLLWW